MASPVIDLAAAVNWEESRIAHQLYDASRTFGYFVLENHSIASESIKELFDDAYDYFATVPDDVKAQWPVRPLSRMA